MAQISTHLNQKPYQIATTHDHTLPFRKWYHHGTHYGVDPKDALLKLFGDIGHRDEKTGEWKIGDLFVRTGP